jgi:serine/threonine-protein kinase
VPESTEPLDPLRPRAVLEVVDGPHRGARFEFDRHETFLVGRAPAAALQLVDDPFFSRHHLMLEINPPRCYLRDLGSSNGTLVNGRRVGECHLNDGDEISGGRTRIRIALSSGPEVPRGVERTRTTALASTLLPDPGEVLTAPRAALGDPDPPPTASPLPAVPGYEVERLLGRGGMGAVYLVRQRATRRKLALKVDLPEAASERAAQLFLREASVLSRLRHDRIVRFHEMGLTGGVFHFVMEYVDAVPIREVLENRDEAGRVRTCCAITSQVLEGLAHAHAGSFVHRDVKPGNILVARRGDAVEAKLSDFGLAKNFENAGLSGITREGQILGTLAFMAPEQVINARFSRPSVDVYAVGATLYHLLSGRLPFDPPGRKDAMAAILEEEPIPVEGHRPSVPAGLAAVVRRAMAKAPPDRYPSADALREALAPFAR